MRVQFLIHIKDQFASCLAIGDKSPKVLAILSELSDEAQRAHLAREPRLKT